MSKKPQSPVRPVEILYQDKWYLAVNKPSGLLVVPTPKKEKRTLEYILNQQYSCGDQLKLYPCHRLDRDTSGVIVFARGKSNQKLLMDEFKKRAIKKTYIAIVHGKLKRSSGTIKSFIKDHGQAKHRKFSKGKLAITQYEVIESRKDFSVLRIFLITGRTNQIRIHFADMEHPLLGERKYAFAKDYSLQFRRTALHSKVISWVHPVTKKTIKISAPLPQDMEDFIQGKNRIYKTAK